MQVIEREIQYGETLDELLKDNVCFFDIETTGLNRRKNLIYLVGILYYDEGRNRLKLLQIFAESLQEEPQLLNKAYKLLSSFDKIINYNGNAFDIPFFNQRLKVNGIESSIPREKSLDIYAYLRANRYVLDLDNLRLKTIEEYLGIERKDIYTGRDCIEFYKRYIETGQADLKEKILQHNYDDLYYLPRVMEILTIVRDKKSFLVKEKFKFQINEIKKEGDFLVFQGLVDDNMGKGFFYEENYQLTIDQGVFQVELEVKEGLISPDETCLFINSYDFDMEDIKLKHKYKIPDHIVPLSIEGKYLIDNINQVLSSLIENIIT